MSDEADLSTDTAPVAGRVGSVLLSVRHLTKTYGPVHAVDDVSLDVYENEIIGVVGDNGAGKSTFISCLIGYDHADAGEVYFRGERVNLSSPAVARRALGVEVIFQDLALAPDLTVWQNLYLGQELRRGRLFLDRATMRSRSDAVLQSLGTKIRATDFVGALSGGERQMTAVARALLFDRDILFMDEPTAAVSAEKAEDVLNLIMRLKARGKTILLISHRLEDVLRVCDRIAVFVNGRLPYVKPASELDVEKLAHLMFQSKITESPNVG
jgi:simple sugar transport system ATP-binding protein